ncbi:TPA: NAD(P)/FAD-dependent oxidoreductase [Serratia marcescens]|uniref:NAD(P)/FAD-dependent oxidoreductase n=1 Tax=Serratia TaxID=613 RepID=UPI002DC03593|nr:FAD-binding oxidoreductase [Serratia marcescens]MEB7509796.1 FAD-binding oxidoreductase [Serratia marcescens]
MPYNMMSESVLNNVWERRAASFAGSKLVENIECDHLIIGAGFTGLSMAYHLLRRAGSRKKVVVIDARELGAGASGRNSGMLGPGIGAQYYILEKRYGRLQAKALFQQTLDAVKYSIGLIERENFDCDMVIGSQFKVATNAANEKRLRQEALALNRAEFSTAMLEGDALRNIVNAPAYHFGLEYRGTATINPAKLLFAMASKVTSLGGKIYLNAPCQALQRHCATSHGIKIRFERAVAATNGYAPLLGMQPGRVIPVSTSLLLSAPMSGAQRSALGMARQHAIIDSRRIFNYFRLTPDHRLLFGGGVPFYSSAAVMARQFKHMPEPAALCERLSADLQRYLPQLGGLAIEQFWSGTIGVTLDNFPVVSINEGTVDAVLGCCGHGLALSLAYGAIYAEQRGTIMREDYPWRRTNAPYLSPAPLLPLASNGYIQFLRWRDRRDER